jgi:hypothetical protein
MENQLQRKLISLQEEISIVNNSLQSQFPMISNRKSNQTHIQEFKQLFNTLFMKTMKLFTLILFCLIVLQTSVVKLHDRVIIRKPALFPDSMGFRFQVGLANSLQANASSGSDIDASEFHTKKCTASVSSGADVRVYATEQLDASASSGGDISYYGNPEKKDINKSSGGGVHGK